MAKDSAKNPLFLEDLAPWNENSNPVWLASTLQLCRNVEKFNFPNKLSVERRKQIVALIGNDLAALPGLKNPTLLKSEESTPIDREFLVEHCLTNESFQQASQGEAFIFDRHGSCIITLNVSDHLHLHYIDITGELEQGWNYLTALETQLGKSLTFSYSPKFGYMTSNPLHCGTGFIASAFLQLSGLIHSGKWSAVVDKLKDDAIAVSGLQGSRNEWIGDLIVVSNNYTLGVNEESIIAALRNFTMKLLSEENAARLQIKQQSNPEIKDKVARAFAILVHSYQMETVEALNEIALLKFGLEMGWISGASMSDLNKLFFSCRRAHLLRSLNGKITLDEVPHKRAEFIHQTLKNVQLLI